MPNISIKNETDKIINVVWGYDGDNINIKVGEIYTEEGYNFFSVEGQLEFYVKKYYLGTVSKNNEGKLIIKPIPE